MQVTPEDINVEYSTPGFRFAIALRNHHTWRRSWAGSRATTRTGAPGAIFGVSSYMFVGQGTQHIVYQGFAGDGQGTGRIHELWWNHNGWHHNDLTSDAHAPLASSAPSGYAFEGQLDGGTQHAIYQGFVVGQGDDGRIHEIWWDENDTHHSDLTTDGHAPPTSTSLSVTNSKARISS